MNNQDNIIATKKAIAGDWLGRPGVTGMDVGFKYVGGKQTADVAIRLFVSKKLAEVTPGERFPGLVGQHKTDVIEFDFEASGKTHKAGRPVSVDYFYNGAAAYDSSHSVTLTVLIELQTPAPTGWTGKIWNQSVSGNYSNGVPWTITNIYQTLTFRATAVGFNQPVFRWWINGQLVSVFNTNVSENVIVTASVRMDTPQNAPANPTTIKLEHVELLINAQGIASAADTAILMINPILAQGHIPLTVRVDVCEVGEASVNPVVLGEIIIWAVATATLDTQVLT
jgi:hypothetical protein